MSKNTPSARINGCALVSVTALLISGIVVIFLLVSIPRQVSEAFGPASPRLAQRQVNWLALQLWRQKSALSEPRDPSGSEQTFRVELGENIPAIARNLEESGLLRDGDAFRNYLLYTGLDVSVQAGEYTLSPAMTAVKIAQTLQDPTPATITFSVLAGWRAEEIAASLPTSGLQIEPEAFLKRVRRHPSGYPFSAEMPAGSDGEGYLAPGLYELPRGIQADELLNTLLNSFQAGLTDEIVQGIQAQGLSLHEGVILASIVPREAIVDDEMSLIASVFLNRLRAGMTLSADPTVQFALGYNAAQSSWWTNPLSLADLQIDSPYNTYLYPGLPSGPISNPGWGALLAVAQPAESPYYFFRAACDGSMRHNFAVDFEGHQNNACP